MIKKYGYDEAVDYEELYRAYKSLYDAGKIKEAMRIADGHGGFMALINKRHYQIYADLAKYDAGLCRMPRGRYEKVTDLKNNIIDYIQREIVDLSILKGDYTDNSTSRMIEQAGVYEEYALFYYYSPLSRKLGNVYADYADPGIFPFVEGQERKELFINAVERLCKYISYE